MRKYKIIKKIVLFSGLLFIFAVILIIISRNAGRDTSIMDEGNDEVLRHDSPDVIIKPFIRDNIQGREIRYSVNAEEGRLYSEYNQSGAIVGQRMEISSIKEIRIFTKDNKIITVSADKAEIYSERNQTSHIFLQGNISVEHPSMGTLRTNTLDFFLRNDEIQTDDPFILEQGESLITGRGFRFNTASNEMHVLSELSGTLYSNSDAGSLPLFFTGSSMHLIDSDNMIIMDDYTIFMYENIWLSSKTTEITLSEEREIVKIGFFEDVLAEIYEADPENPGENYRLFSKETVINFKDGIIDHMELNKGFLIENINKDIYLSGWKSLVLFRESRLDRIFFYNGFYANYEENGLFAFTGYMDSGTNRIFSDSSPILYNYPYVTQAKSITINIDAKHLNAEDNVHTIVPDYDRRPDKRKDSSESPHTNRLDIHSDILDYAMEDDLIWYKNNCKLYTDSLTITAYDIKLYNKTQLAQFTGNVRGEVFQLDPDSNQQERLLFETEYMHYDTKGDTILLKEVSNKYPAVWQMGFRASGRSIIIKQEEDYVFFSEDVNTIFFREFYESSAQSGFFSFDNSDMPVEVMSESLEIFNAQNFIKYDVDVFAKKGNNTLTTDTMLVYLNDDKSINRVVCNNNLKIASAETYVEGGHGTFFSDRSEFHIDEDVIYRDRMTSLQNAEKLVYYIDENRYVVYGTDIKTTYRFDETFTVPRLFPKRSGGIR